MNSLNDFKKNAKEILEAVPDIYLILDKNLSIVGVSNSYLQIMHAEREKIVGNCIFELFTNDPNTDNTQLLKGLRYSLKRVLVTKKPDSMPMQKFHISSDRKVNLKYLSQLNTPVLDSQNEVLYIIHRIIDMTSFVKNKKITKETQAKVYSYLYNIEGINHKLSELESIRLYPKKGGILIKLVGEEPF